MSKSDPDPGSCIFINDPTEVLREKVKKSVTDSIREVEYDPLNRPGTVTGIQIVNFTWIVFIIFLLFKLKISDH